jgi:DNA-directed RNA polymerase subunit M/transcription elongation factor TFIIS
MNFIVHLSDVVICVAVYYIVALLASITGKLKINYRVATAIKNMWVLLIPAIACYVFAQLDTADLWISNILTLLWEPCAIYVIGGVSLLCAYSSARWYYRPSGIICPRCQCQNSCVIGKIVDTRLIKTTRPIFSNITNRQIDETDWEYTLYKREFKCEKCGHTEIRWFTASNTFANDYID